MNYYERYGEIPMSDEEERIAQERIDNQERIENLEKCLKAIKDIVNSTPNTEEELLDLVSEIKYEVNSIDL